MKRIFKYVDLPANVREAMEWYNLVRFWRVGSDSYPNIIGAKIEGNNLQVEYLQLDGFTKSANYPWPAA